MKTITKELVLLDVEDIEEAVTNFLEKDETVKISQMDCTLLYNTPTDTGITDGMCFDITVEKDLVDAFDLFWDDDSDVYICKGQAISLNEKALEPEDIFNFDTHLFKSFKVEADC